MRGADDGVNDGPTGMKAAEAAAIGEHVRRFAELGEVRALAARLGSGGAAAVSGSQPSAAGMLAGAVLRETGRSVVLVTAHLDDADEAADELSSVGVEVLQLPALEVLPGESAVSAELFAERVAACRRAVDEGDRARVYVAPIQALMQSAPSRERLERLTRTVWVGEEHEQEGLIEWLAGAGYVRTSSVEEPGEFAVRGGIVDVFPPEGAAHVAVVSEGGGDAGAGAVDEPLTGSGERGGGGVRLDFFGDEVDAINEIDLATMGSDRRLAGVRFTTISEEDLRPGKGEAAESFLDYVPSSAVALLADTLEATEQARGYYERVTDDAHVFGPPRVFAQLRERFHALCEFAESARELAESDKRVEAFALPLAPIPELPRDVSEAIERLCVVAGETDVVVLTPKEAEATRFDELLGEFGTAEARERISVERAYLHRGFVMEGEVGDGGGGVRPVLLLPYHELLHRFSTRRRVRRLSANSSSASSREAFLELAVGDLVVHADHGIAKFVGLKSMAPKAKKPTASEAAELKLRSQSEGLNAKQRRELKRQLEGKAPRERGPAGVEDAATEEYLTLEFAKGARLHVPASQIDKVQKYIGSSGRGGKTAGRAAPQLSALGGKRWQSQKESVKASVKDLAAELLRVQAARESVPGIRYPRDTPWQKEFEAEFPYQETEDQLAALSSIKRNMTDATPMDRLLCGDVGFGKTELAIRAAFKAAEYGKQVAVLVPTTILADQHERTFRARFADYPFTVEGLSRFKSKAEQTEILKRVKQGQVDVLIGTHRLLSNDVKFADLGLVIIDEEQRFGVEHKNKLLQFRLTADVLTLSATPIPRTLHMAMLGLRDISSLSTPPLDRRAVVTEVIPYNEQRIKQAIHRELNRQGQVFFLHNRVHNIESVADDVQRMAPDARIVVGHGQMPERELEAVMREFLSRRADILVSTTIIESGIDIPTANTMFINDAQRFGLAELHQLRGRVGRYKHRAYCYLLLPQHRSIPEVARKRLRAIEEFSMLGAGFRISMRDLEIRGAGNLLGSEQSGHIAAVGYDMYCQLLEQSARELRGESTAAASETSIEIGATGSIPKRYIASDTRRLEAYRRVSSARDQEALDAVERDLRDAYGEPTESVRLLLDVARIRMAASSLGVKSIQLREPDVIYRTAELGRLQRALEGSPGTLRHVTPRHGGDEVTELFHRPPEQFLEIGTLITFLRRRLTAAAERDAGGGDGEGEGSGNREGLDAGVRIVT